MRTFSTEPRLRDWFVIASAAGLALGAPMAELACAKMAPDQHRCGDIGQAPGGLAQMIAPSTAASLSAGFSVVVDQTIGDEREVLPPEHTKFRLFQDLRAKPMANL